MVLLLLKLSMVQMWPYSQIRQTKDVGLNGTCYISNTLSVLGTSAFGNTLTLSKASGGGGGIKVVASTNGNEEFIVYNYSRDARADFAGDMWVGGVSCWSRTGYNIGKPIY